MKEEPTIEQLRKEHDAALDLVLLASKELRAASDEASTARSAETAALNRRNNAVKTLEEARKNLDAKLQKEIRP